MMDTLYHLTIKKVLKELVTARNFGILVDETSDITNNEQMFICISITPNDFVHVELFLASIHVDKTIVEALMGCEECSH